MPEMRCTSNGFKTIHITLSISICIFEGQNTAGPYHTGVCLSAIVNRLFNDNKIGHAKNRGYHAEME